MSFDTYIKFEGIEGEATDEKHKNWVEVFSYSHGIAQQGSGVIASHGARTAGKCDHHDFTVTKKLDSASSIFNRNCCMGKHITKATVEVCKSTGDKQVFMKYILEDVVVASVNVGGGQGQECPVETVSFQYSKIKWDYSCLDPKTGNKIKNVPAEWSVLENKGS